MQKRDLIDEATGLDCSLYKAFLDKAQEREAWGALTDEVLLPLPAPSCCPATSPHTAHLRLQACSLTCLPALKDSQCLSLCVHAWGSCSLSLIYALFPTPPPCVRLLAAAPLAPRTVHL